MKIRVICLSKALRGYEALMFARTFKGQIEAKFVYSRIDDGERWPERTPRYYVVRIPLMQERRIKAHDMMVEEGEVLDKIPVENLQSTPLNDRTRQAVTEPDGDMTNDEG